MSPLSDEARSLTWLVNDFVAHVPGVTHTVVVSVDGLLLIASDEFACEQAEQLAAIVSGIRGLGESISKIFGLGPCTQTIIRMQRGHLIVMAISDGSCLATLAAAGCDMKVVAYQMTILAESSDHVLTPQLRRELRTEIRRAQIR